jgi:alkylation response protein AidB-like acyl-CoA dehydrogenase
MIALVPPVTPLPDAAGELRAQVREFIAGELAADRFTPRCDSWHAGWDEAFSRRLGARGWLGMTIPVGYGGQGRAALERYVVTEELLAAGAPVAAHWIADRQTAPSLLRYGTEQQKERYLPGIARGECYVALGLSEPDAGSDLAGVRTRAARVAGGWELAGTKVWTTGAHHAHVITVLARSGPPDGRNRHAGLSQFLVNLPDPAVRIRPVRLLSGEHHFNEVVLDGVFVPDDMVLGEPGAGWRQVTAELAFERSGPERFLSTFPLLEALVRQLAEQQAAAGPGGEGGAVAADAAALGEIVARVWTLRQMSLAVAGALARGDAPEVAAALVKDLGTRLENEVIDVARRLARVEPAPAAPGLPGLLAGAVMYSPGFTLRGGTNEILRGVVARALGLR